MADIFISYASPDRETARILANILTQRGHSVWWDRTIPPGRVFDEVIQEALTAARCIIVLWSAQSIRSNWVKTEASEALTRNRLVPALIAPVLPPIEFKRIQAANLTGWQGEIDGPEFLGLMAAVERLLQQPDDSPSPPPIPVDMRREKRASGSRWGLTAAIAIAAIASIVAIVLSVLYFTDGNRRPTTVAGRPDAVTAPQTLPAGAAPAPAAALAPRGDRVNLLLAANGGEILTAADSSWTHTVDGDDATYGTVLYSTVGKADATFGFRDGRSATFDTVAVLIPGRSDRNVRQFELLASNEGPLGRFQSIGVFTTQNMLMLKTPFQAFTFAPVTATTVKIRPLSTQGENYSMELYEFQLVGRVN